MNTIFANRNPYWDSFSRNWIWFFLWGLIEVILGLVAISAATFTTVLSVIFIGIVLLISGGVIIVDCFGFWWGKWSGFFLHLLMSSLYAAAGLILINSPVLSSISLTLFLGIFYLLLGIFRLCFAALLQTPKWGWSFFNGLLSMLLGILIIANLPSSALYVIGLFIGIDLIFCGLAYIMTALSVRRRK